MNRPLYRRTFSALLGVLLMGAASAAAVDEPVTPATTVPAATRRAKVVIALAGDSTMTDKSGWGVGFAHSTQGDIQVLNFSQGGRSSKSFRDEGHWKKVLAAKPDYVLIQFGHNDQPGKGPERETDPKTTFKQLMGQYVDEARAIGAQPIVISSVSRRAWGEDGKIHSTLTPWADAAREVAAEKKVPFIDLHTLSVALYEKQGKEAINLLSPEDPKTKGVDNTHFNAKGSETIGPIIAAELKKLVPALDSYLK